VALVLLSAAVTAPRACAQGCAFAGKLPEFSLKDPTDEVHGHKELLARGAVLIVTIPNVKHGALQEQWKRHLKKTPWPADGPRLAYLEDLSQSNVPERARKGMKDGYEPGATLLFVDPTGEVRRALRVPQDETVVLVYNREGRLVHSVTGLETADEIREAARKVRAVVDQLRGEADAEKPPAPVAPSTPNGAKADTATGRAPNTPVAEK
jgi:hypothetical protein